MRKPLIVAVVAAIIAIGLFLILQAPREPQTRPGQAPQAPGNGKQEPETFSVPDDGKKPPVEIAPPGSGEKTTTAKPEDSGDDNEGSIISGTVMLPDGSPAKRAMVVAVGFAGRGAAVANDEGIYRIKRLKPGDYTVSASLDGFVLDMRQRVAVTASNETAGIDFTLLRGGTVEGTLLDESGGGVVGEVCLSGAAQEGKAGQAYRGRSGEDGKFRIGCVLPGRYRMEVYTTGYLPVDAVEIEVIDEQTQNTETVLRKGGWISGIVMNESNEPVKDAEVYASSIKKDGTGASDITDGKGGFTLKPLTGGSYTVKAMHDDYPHSIPVVVSLIEGKGKDGLQIILLKDAGGIISGRVVSGGMPVERASVAIMSRDSIDNTITDADGQFFFRSVKYGVDMTVKAQGYKTRSFNGVRPGKTGLTVELEEAGLPVSGKVTLEGEKAVSNITIHVFRIDGETGKEVKAGVHPFFEKFPEFKFLLYLPNGEYRLRFVAQGYESQDRTITVAGKSEEIELTLGKNR